jgi:hypothetical protein
MSATEITLRNHHLIVNQTRSRFGLATGAALAEMWLGE